MDTLEFLTSLYGNLEPNAGHLVLWSRAKGAQSFLTTDLAAAADYAVEHGQKEDVYFSVGLQKTHPVGWARGEARTVSCVTAFWLDLDIGGGAHAAKNLPTTEQAKRLLEQVPWQATITVQTGGGLHLYWPLKEPWILGSADENVQAQQIPRLFQRHLIHDGKGMGFHVDSTFALNQLLRLPGTLNHKYDPPFKVSVQSFDPNCRYAVDEIRAGLPQDAVSATSALQPGRMPGTLPLADNFAPANLGLIEKRCAFMASCRDNSASLSEPSWFCQASIIGRCKDGEELFHERSSNYPGYDQPEAQAKLLQAQKYGPRTCIAIARDLGFSGCDACPFRQHIKSPIRLGDETPLAQARITIAKSLSEAKTDPGAMFTDEALEALVLVGDKDKSLMMRVRDALKKLGVPLKKLEEAVKGRLRETKASGNLYYVKNNAFFMDKVTMAGVVEMPLGTFSCAITQEVTRDDGAEKTKQFLIEGVHESGQPFPPVEVSVAQFTSLNWTLDNYGSKAVIYAGCRDHFRTAIQVLSENVVQRDLYCHTGWRKIGDEMAFLHGDGALGHTGNIENIEVDLGEGGLESFNLETPNSKAQLKKAIQASLRTLDLAPLEISAPLLAATFLAPLGEVVKHSFSLFIAGLTGTRKSEIAAIAQGHFGRDFHGKNLPANWTSTENSLEKASFLAKDTIVVIDDFNPTGSQYDIAVFHRKAERLFRGQGNQAGRQRMRADGTLRVTYYPRCLLIGTGEDLPKGHSLRARMLIVEIQPTNVDLEVLTKLQEARDEGVLAQAMGGYIQWLAPKLDELTETLPERKQALRQEALDAGKAHARTPDIVAGLMIGIEMFLQFATALGAITEDKAGQLWTDCQKAINEVARRQGDVLEEEDPVRRFLDLLGSAMSGGNAHLEGTKGGLPKATPEAYGWRETSTIVNNTPVTDHRPHGKRVGWVDDYSVYLDPDVAFAVAQSLANSQGHPIAIGEKTLRKRMADQGLIVSSDNSLNTKRINLSGTRRRVVHLSREALHPDITKPEELPGHFGTPKAGGNCLI